MSQENRVKIGRDNYKTTDGTPHLVEPSGLPVSVSSNQTVNYNSGLIVVTATSIISLLEANANDVPNSKVSTCKVGQKLTVRVLASAVATILANPSSPTTGATPNIIIQPNGSPTTSIAATGVVSITFRYLGNSKFNVVDYSIGASGGIVYT
jgi:hypothetical protein